MVRTYLRRFIALCIGSQEIERAIEEATARRLAEENQNVVQKALEEVWVSRDGRVSKIAEMTASHAKHSLALVMRTLREDKAAYINERNVITFAPIMRDLVDGEIAFINEAGKIVRTNRRSTWTKT